jgi:isoleucyl-tRNA synthetase
MVFKSIDPNHNFIEMEHKWLAYWYEIGIVDAYFKKNKNSKKYFSFLDGPITANNPMGVHHAWGRTYKDLWQKFFNLLGYQERFQQGFDCQGLWVEVEVEKELGLKNKKEIENLVPGDKKASIAKFVDLCKQRVYRFSKIQTEQSKRLGYFSDWEHSYYTMSDENNYIIWHFLKKCYENGWIYKGQESVPWCPRCQTAISEHEILTEDYTEVVHKAIYFKLPLIDDKFNLKKAQYFLVWTTTPWTIPANIALAVNKDLDYVLVEYRNEYYWMVKEAVERLFKDKNEYKITMTVKGRDLEGIRYKGPFDDLPAVKDVANKNEDKFHFVFVTDENILPVSKDEGTGIVHTAVSAGTEDFKMGKKLGLPMIPVIDDEANYLKTMGFLAQKNAKKHPEIILDYLQEKGFALKIENYKHRYPRCWRCKTELVWKVADEWYIAMDKNPLEVKSSKSKVKSDRRTLRERMMAVAKKIRWIPEFGLDRELDWLKNMHDWLISKKNRYWGLSLPIYECKKCGFFEVIGSREELKEKAIEGWEVFDGHSPHKPYIDEVKIRCQKCGNLVSRIDDVGNPWLDAGIVPFSTIKKDNQGEPLYLSNRKEWEKWFPADFITESFPGQFKNWFYALIAMATVLEDANPFKTVLGYGTLLGEDGRPMHKSWGNSIEFNEGADKIGVDVMRWMYARQNPADNMLFGYKKADEVRRLFYLLLWNIYRFFVDYATLEKFEPKKDDRYLINERNLTVLDQWIISRLSWLIGEVKKNVKDFNVKEAAMAVEKFVDDLSTWYLRLSRDRVWVNSDNKKDKQIFYQTLYFVLINLSIILSPIIPFITEEIYTNLTGEKSVHLSCWPENLENKYYNQDLEKDMELIRQIVEIGRRVRKENKVKVRQPLAKVEIFVPQANRFINQSIKNDAISLIAKELNVKSVTIDFSDVEEIKVKFDFNLNEALIFEGEVRELIRRIQQERKLLQLSPDKPIVLQIPEKFRASADYIKRRVIASELIFADSLKITK